MNDALLYCSWCQYSYHSTDLVQVRGDVFVELNRKRAHCVAEPKHKKVTEIIPEVTSETD
jgi:hypothetical protein